MRYPVLDNYRRARKSGHVPSAIGLSLIARAVVDAVDALLEEPLPPLSGTPKQVAWAEKIRFETVAHTMAYHGPAYAKKLSPGEHARAALIRVCAVLRTQEAR